MKEGAGWVATRCWSKNWRRLRRHLLPMPACGNAPSPPWRCRSAERLMGHRRIEPPRSQCPARQLACRYWEHIAERGSHVRVASEAGPGPKRPAANGRSGADVAPPKPQFMRRQRWITTLEAACWALLAALFYYLLHTQLQAAVALSLVLAIAGAAIVVSAIVIALRSTGDRREDEPDRGKSEPNLRALEQVTDPALGFLPIDELLETLLDRMLESVRGDVISLLLIAADRKSMYVRATRGDADLVPRDTALSIGKGVLGDVAQWTRPVVVEDVQSADPGSEGSARGSPPSLPHLFSCVEPPSASSSSGRRCSDASTPATSASCRCWPTVAGLPSSTRGSATRNAETGSELTMPDSTSTSCPAPVPSSDKRSSPTMPLSRNWATSSSRILPTGLPSTWSTHGATSVG